MQYEIGIPADSEGISMQSKNINTWFSRLALANLIYAIFVICWGAFVRATGSGAGCGSHWPLCNGEMVPRAPLLETVIELTHRLTSGVLLILALVMLVMAFKFFPKGNANRKWSLISFVILIIEALIGASLVIFGLVEDNSSLTRSIVIGAHLVNTMLLVGALTINHWIIRTNQVPKNLFHGTFGKLSALGLGLMLFVGASGAIVALGDTLFPVASLAEGFNQHLNPAAHFLIKIRVWHPILAISTGFYLMLLGNWVLQNKPRGLGANTARAVVGIVLLQLSVGVINLYLLVPLWTQMAHLMLANLLWIIQVRMWLFVSRDIETELAEKYGQPSASASASASATKTAAALKRL